MDIEAFVAFLYRDKLHDDSGPVAPPEVNPETLCNEPKKKLDVDVDMVRVPADLRTSFRRASNWFKKFLTFFRECKKCRSSVKALRTVNQMTLDQMNKNYREETERIIQECRKKHYAEVDELAHTFQNKFEAKEAQYKQRCEELDKLTQFRQNMLDKDYRDKQNKLDREFQAKESEWERKAREAENGLETSIRLSDRCEKIVKGLVEETAQSHPWLANELADIQDLYYAEVEHWMRTKPHPAQKRADDLKILRTEKREVDAKCKQLEFQVKFWKSVLPWLEDFQDVPDKEAWKYKDGASSDAEEYEVIREFLSPDEYNKLPQSQKYQVYVDRYLTMPSSSAWKAGIKFERYIGYLLESKGWKVEYRGALYGLDDMGIDLIASKDGENIAIQCKWWKEFKTIHENSICQLVGSTAMMSVRDGKKYTPVFVCTCALSDTARDVAKYLNVKLVEIPDAGESIKKYPCIKCNASGSEKIYHLPFDQMYDRTQIAGKKDSFFVHTIAEAEAAGFRHAYRHKFGAQ